MNKVKMLVMGVMMAMGAFMVGAPVFATPCPSGTLREGEDLPSVAQCNLPKEDKATGDGNLFATVQNIINWVLAVLGLVAVIMIIVGGVTYMTSQGDPGKTKKARDTILYGIIGLVIALLAYAIVNFVLANVFGGSSTTTSS